MIVMIRKEKENKKKAIVTENDCESCLRGSISIGCFRIERFQNWISVSFLLENHRNFVRMPLFK